MILYWFVTDGIFIFNKYMLLVLYFHTNNFKFSNILNNFIVIIYLFSETIFWLRDLQPIILLK